MATADVLGRKARTSYSSLCLVALLAVFCPTFLFADEDEENAAAEVEVARLDRDRAAYDAMTGGDPSDETVVARRVAGPFQLLAPSSDAVQPTVKQTRPTNRYRRSGVAMNAIPCPHHDRMIEEPATALPVARPTGQTWLHWLGIDDMWDAPARGDAARSYIPSPTVPHDQRFAAVGRLANHYGFRQLRKMFRSQLRDRVSQDPTFRYYDYLEERDAISTLGRSNGRDGSLAVAEARRSVLADSDSEDAAEQDLAVLSWGPLQVDDRGRLQVELQKLREDPPSSVDELEIAPEESEKPLGDSLFRGRSYRVNTAVKFRPRVDRYDEGFREILGEVGGRVEVDFFTPILERRFLGTEFEATVDEEGRTAFFVTFKLYQR